MEKRIKYSIIISAIILILIIILLNIITIKDITKDKMIKILDKGIKNLNFSESILDYETQDETGKRYIKGNIEKCVFNDGQIWYYDYNEAQTIEIYPETQEIIISENDGKYSGPQASALYRKELEEKEYKYIGSEKVDGNTILIFDIILNKENKKNIVVDKKTGLVTKVKYYQGNELIYEQEYSLNTNDVTKEDVSEPDLSNYADYSIENM